MGRVSGKIALVTGAASGIGRGCSVALAAEGAKIVASDVDEIGLNETAGIIRKAGGTVSTLKQDVTSEERWAEVIAAIEKELGALHVLVNNAGIAVPGPLFNMTLVDWRRQNAINLDGVFLGMKHGVPLLTKSGGGSIINMSSVAGLMGTPGLAGYGAGKAAVRYLSKSAALECAGAKNKIRVNSVHPGMIDTAIWNKMHELGMGQMKPGSNKIDLDTPAAQSVPLGYPGQPADIAAGVVFLASDESHYVTGTELVIDGGISL